MRQSLLLWETTTTLILICCTSYYVISTAVWCVSIPSSFTTVSSDMPWWWWWKSSSLLPPHRHPSVLWWVMNGVNGEPLSQYTHPHHTQTTSNNKNKQKEEPHSLQEPTRRPTIQNEEEEEDDDVILLDYDASPKLSSTDEKEEYDLEPNYDHQDHHHHHNDNHDSIDPPIGTTPPDTTNNSNNSDKAINASDVIVMALVDGTLVGLSRTTGRTLWKQPPPSTSVTSSQYTHPLVKPFVSTTTTIGSSSSSSTHHQPFRNTMAVPSILDGKVYLTSTSEDCTNLIQHAQNRHMDSDDDDDEADHFNTGEVCDLVEDTVTTTIHNLMMRTPFVDMKNHGRIYTSQRHSVAVAIHSTTGKPIRTMTTTTTSPLKQDASAQLPVLTDPMMAIRETDVLEETETDTTTKTTTTTTDKKNHNDSSNTKNDKQDDILWLGRTDYTISVHEPITGELDVQFTMAEMMSIHDMLLLENNNHHHPTSSNQNHQQQILRQYLLPHRSDPNTQSKDDTVIGTDRAVTSSSSSSSSSTTTRTEPSFLYGLIATPNGHVAYRHLYTGQIIWVAPEAFLNTPAVYAFDAKSGRSIRVDIVPDVISPHGTMEYVSNELQKQLYEHHSDTTGTGHNPYQNVATAMNEPVFGALPGSGQIYAIPLLQKGTTTTTSGTTSVGMDGGSGYLNHQQYESTSVMKTHTIPDAARAYVSGGLQGNVNHNVYHHDYQQSHYCHPNSPHYPRCLNYGYNIHNSGGGPDRFGYNHNHFQNRPIRNTFPNTLSDVSSFQYPNHHGYGNARAGQNSNDNDDDDAVGDASGAVVPFYHPDYGYQYIPPDHFYTINTEWNEQYRRKKRYKKFMRIITSWFLPTVVAALFVTSFELGRRKKFKNEKDSDSNIVTTDGQQAESSNDVGIIQVNEDIILGHGGHGTVVYKGMLEGRQVAVKRLLKTYNASADREISLLIESDGHPNVVRYHLKETRGDFVYLALELCDLSLHDLIGHIRSRQDRMGPDEIDEKEKIFQATKSVLLQITKGAEHLHRLRIVHRDLKPANILLASKKGQKYNKTIDSKSSTIYDLFTRGDYIAKISDMGLGKQLAGQSSYGGSLLNESSMRAESYGAQSSIIGIGPGSVGWQAPEVMRLRMPSDVSVKSDDALSGNPNDTGSDFSPMDIMSSNRTSRSVDVFSLGCIFYSTLLPGSHPFGEWYERESNIMHDRPNLTTLESLSLEAHDLVSSMLCRDPLARPTAKQICDHPFFWTSDRRLCLLCDLSDRLEQDAVIANGTEDTSFQAMLLAVEKNALKVVGTSWDRLLDPELINNVQRFRSYDPSSIRDLLRLIRNKFHHFDELPDTFKESIGSTPEGLSQYFSVKFPRLLLHAYHFCQSAYPCDDILNVKYAIPAFRMSSRTRGGLPATKTEAHHNRMAQPLITVSNESADVINESKNTVLKPFLSIDNEPHLVDENCTKQLSSCVVSSDYMSDDGASESVNVNVADSATPTDDEDIIIWAGSTSAKAFQCRGWNRSDDEWQYQSDLISRRRDVNLVRCAEDPKFRTRLCNHWDESLGTFCPMRKKNKCIFAHGPVELRVKEAKRSRWGKLVDENGDCNNARHSGGEDTYGAARSIENERKQEGKWSAKTANGTKSKSVGATKKKSPKLALD